MKKTLLITAAVLVLIAVGVYAGTQFFAKTDGKTPVVAVETTYKNEEVGVSFAYPDTYELQERNLTINGDMVRIITLLPKGVVIPEGGEGSTAITLAVFDEKEPISLTDWVHTMTNTFPVPTDGFDYQETEVGGEKALAYTSTGLYESDNVAIAKENKVYVFSASWLTRDDQILKDFTRLLASVSFTK